MSAFVMGVVAGFLFAIFFEEICDFGCRVIGSVKKNIDAIGKKGGDE